MLRFERISGVHYAFGTLADTRDQSPAPLPDLILDRRRPLVEFHSGAARLTSMMASQCPNPGATGTSYEGPCASAHAGGAANSRTATGP
jgi:hypothetical protein